MELETFPMDFPAQERASRQLFFLRFARSLDFYKIFKSLTLPTVETVTFVTCKDGKAVTIMSEHDRCLQGFLF